MSSRAYWGAGRLVWSLVAAACLMGCPADDPTGGGETGGGLPPEPLDPFEGEGSDPPGAPDPSATWRPPSSLGNGLVHDTRFDIAEHGNTYTHEVSGAELAAGVDWADFVGPHEAKSNNGFRPTAVDALVSITGTPDGATKLHIVDHSAYASDDDVNYRHETRTYAYKSLAAEQALAQSGAAAPGEPRPLSIDSYALEGWVGASVVWVYDDNPVPYSVVVGQTLEPFLAQLESLSAKGYRPISLASRRRDGASEYSAVFIQDDVPAGDWELSLGLDWTSLQDAADIAWAAGYYPARGTYEQGSEALPSFSVIWARRSPGLTLEMRYNLDHGLFDAEDTNWRERGYYLENAMTYLDGGEPRYAGLWVRHEPYLRYKDGLTVDEDSALYQTRYAPFHEAIADFASLEGDGRQGEFGFPSVTLTILDQGQLALSRGYTYGPAIYPETEPDAAMLGASIAKSITAAAVVRELALQNAPLQAPLFAIAGIPNSPQAFQAVQVVDVLRNRGGFRGSVESYSNHKLIAEAIDSGYPISRQDWFEYLIGNGGPLFGNIMDANTYWDPTLFSDAGSSVTAYRYSNPGFSVLGELVQLLSGQDYAAYVSANLLQPLEPTLPGISSRIFPDSGHKRLTSTEPPLCSLRSYLGQSLHPYDRIDCTEDADCNYLGNDGATCTDEGLCIGCVPGACREGWFCELGTCVNVQAVRTDSSPPPPVISASGDVWTGWGVNTGPADAAAPESPVAARYAGGMYMGGVPLAAGGWFGDGEAFAVLARAVNDGAGLVMPPAVAASMWNPQFWNPNNRAGPGWNYGLGCYVRGNWVAWAGGTDGGSGLILHNRAYDFTVAVLANLRSNQFGEWLNELLLAPNAQWNTSTLGQLFPCVDDPNTAQPECPVATPSTY